MASRDTPPEETPIASPEAAPSYPGGPFHRWTELISRRPPPWRALWHALQVVALIYAFLCAINMMGKGIKTIAANPAYVKQFPNDPAFAAYRDQPDSAQQAAVLPLQAGGEALLGRTVGTIGLVDSNGGYVAIGNGAVRAICLNAEIAHHSCGRVVGVRPGEVLVEPVPEHKDWLYTIFHYAKNPFLALMVGVLITAIFQSSSFTTSFTVGMVATVSGFPIELAIPVVMGANIGTSVTNIMVSLGYINRRDEFRRAFAGATVHDFFNVLTVAVLFVLEQTTGVLHLLAERMAGLVYHGGAGAIDAPPKNFIKIAVKPAISAVEWMLSDLFGFGQNATGIAMTILAIILLFAALLLLVKVLRSLVLKRAESFFDRVLFRNAPTAFMVGLILTALVQSSSVTTSLAIPLIAAGLLTLQQVFPYMLGANIGTTITALMAAFATSATTEEGAKLGLTLACVHLLFNVIGAIIFYPFRWIPIGLATALANKAAESKRYAVLFILGVFFGLPILGIIAYHLYTKAVGG